jgi:hypothetical protein
MKKIITITLFCIVALFTQATIRTVSNVPSTLAQYNTIQAAIDASNNGDTVYVHGSPNAYSAFTISNKKITVIGPGWSPDKNLPLGASVPGITLTGASAAGTEIQGLVITSTVDINTNHPDNLKFIRNYFSCGQLLYLSQGSVTYIGYLFEGNIFDNSYLIASTSGTYQNFIFQNNYFYGNGGCVGTQLNGFTNSVNVLFNHNLFFGPSNSVVDIFGSNCRFLTLTNNIFVHRNVGNQNSLSTFNNNITYYPNATAPTDPWLVNSNVNSGGNVSNQNPQMAAQSAVNAGTDNALADYTIAAGPANNSSSDGKDMGLLYDATGSLNWSTSRTSRLPFVYSMNITNPTIPQAGTLNVQVEARKNN